MINTAPGIHLERLAYTFDRDRQVAAAQRDQTKELQRIAVARIQAQNVSVDPLGLGQPSGPMMLKGLGEPRGDRRHAPPPPVTGRILDLGRSRIVSFA